MKKQRFCRKQIEHGILTGCYPTGFTFKDLLAAKYAYLGRPIGYAVGFKHYPIGTTRHDLEPLINSWRNPPVSAWDDLVEHVSQKERTLSFCAGQMADRIVATPEVAFVLQPLDNILHAEILDHVYSRTHYWRGDFNAELLPRRTKVLLAQNTQVFLYILQNHPNLANHILPYRKPRAEALAMVRRRLVGPVVDAKHVRANSQNSCPAAFADMLLAYPRLCKTLATNNNKFHRRIVDCALSSEKLTPKTRSALAAAVPYAVLKML